MVDETTIRRDLFRAIYNLVNDNKPANWYVKSYLSNATADFPLIIVNPINVSSTKWGMGFENREKEIIALFEIICHIDSGPSVIDVGRDNLNATLINSTNSKDLYETYNLMFESLEDGGYSVVEFNDQTYISATVIVRFRFS